MLIVPTRAIEGFFSRQGGFLPQAGVIWDLNDTLLNLQGMLDAVSLNLALHDPHFILLDGHSLGAARVSTLVASGWAPVGGVTHSLPFFAIPAQGVSGSCGNWDIVCFGAVQNALRDTIGQTAPSPERNSFLWQLQLMKNHTIDPSYPDFPGAGLDWRYIDAPSWGNNK